MYSIDRIRWSVHIRISSSWRCETVKYGSMMPEHHSSFIKMFKKCDNGSVECQDTLKGKAHIISIALR